jgi:hypothetical protein
MTVEEGKRIADANVKESGHVCDGACKNWELIIT